ncbi:MAG: SPASM domain-containing protein, partial [Nitrospirae bacterium]|nr:SPASM domain-containing protein [Nitrospirota bacterium]
RSLCLFSAGEPLLARNWDGILQHCIDNLPKGVDINFSTNGLLFTEQKILPLLGRDINITISIDGATKATYEAIRPGAFFTPVRLAPWSGKDQVRPGAVKKHGGSFERLLNNIRLINTLKDKYHTDKPSIEIAFAASRDNVTELPLIAKLAVELRAVQLVIAQRIFFNEDDFRRCSLLFARELFDENLQKAVEICHPGRPGAVKNRGGISIIHGGTYSSLIPPPEGLINRFFDMRPNGRFACRTAQEHVSIGFKGLIRACCFIDHLFMGNLNHNTMMEVWHGAHYRHLRLDISNGRFGDGCKNCPFFQLLGRHEAACLRRLNTSSYIEASPRIEQPYNIFALNSEFQGIMDDWRHGRKVSKTVIEGLLRLWQQDNYLFEVANNIGVIYALTNDIASARQWIGKAYAINPLDALLQENYNEIS